MPFLSVLHGRIRGRSPAFGGWRASFELFPLGRWRFSAGTLIVLFIFSAAGAHPSQEAVPFSVPVEASALQLRRSSMPL